MKLKAWLGIVLGTVLYALLNDRSIMSAFESSYWAGTGLLLAWWMERKA